MNRHLDADTPGLIGDWTFRTVSRGRSYDITHHTRPAEVVGKPIRVRTKNAV